MNLHFTPDEIKELARKDRDYRLAWRPMEAVIKDTAKLAATPNMRQVIQSPRKKTFNFGYSQIKDYGIFIGSGAKQACIGKPVIINKGR